MSWMRDTRCLLVLTSFLCKGSIPLLAFETTYYTMLPSNKILTAGILYTLLYLPFISHIGRGTSHSGTVTPIFLGAAKQHAVNSVFQTRHDVAYQFVEQRSLLTQFHSITIILEHQKDKSNYRQNNALLIPNSLCYKCRTILGEKYV